MRFRKEKRLVFFILGRKIRFFAALEENHRLIKKHKNELRRITLPQLIFLLFHLSSSMATSLTPSNSGTLTSMSSLWEVGTF
jgi:hypothetical protein